MVNVEVDNVGDIAGDDALDDCNVEDIDDDEPPPFGPPSSSFLSLPLEDLISFLKQQCAFDSNWYQ